MGDSKKSAIESFPVFILNCANFTMSSASRARSFLVAQRLFAVRARRLSVNRLGPCTKRTAKSGYATEPSMSLHPSRLDRSQRIGPSEKSNQRVCRLRIFRAGADGGGEANVTLKRIGKRSQQFDAFH